MKLLVTYSLPREPFEELPADWEVTIMEGERINKADVLRILPDFDFMLSTFGSPVDQTMIDAGKKLKMISNYGVGYNNIDIRYAREKGITVCNTPQSVCNPTAELCLALILSTARRTAELDRRIRTEKETLWGTMKNLGVGLEGKTLGIIGMGRIGQNVARKAEAFGMRIIYHNRRTEIPGYKRCELDALLQESDFISLHTPLDDSSHHLIGKRELGLMKKTAILINTSRGAVIDEIALCEALKNKQIAAAGLDVFEQEPHITEELYNLDNVVLLPHVGTATIDARIAMAREALNNIKQFIAGKPINVVN